MKPDICPDLSDNTHGQRPQFDPIRHITRAAAARRANVVPRTLRRWEETRGLKPIHFNARMVGYDRQEFELISQEYAPNLPANAIALASVT